MAGRDTEGAAALAEEAQPLPAGTVIDGRYRLIAEIGAGGMGRVYEAEHMFLRRRMALKLLRGGHGAPEAAARMVQEATLAGQVPHPAIVRVLDCADLGGGQVYVAMELLRGESLAAALRRPGCAAEILPWLADVARGLAAAHRVGVVHRDVKPANILLARDPSGAVQAKLLDFGVAKLLPGAAGPDAVQTRAGAVLGTPHYLAPEQARGAAIDGRADLYSLGVILYELLTGALPFDGAGFMAILAQHLHAPPLDPRQAAPGRGIPDGAALLTMRLLAKDPQARPPDGDAVAAAISALLRDEGEALARVATGASGADAGTLRVAADGLAEGTGAGTLRVAVDGLAEGAGAGTLRVAVDGLAEGTGAVIGLAEGTGARRPAWGAMFVAIVLGVGVLVGAGALGWMAARAERGGAGAPRGERGEVERVSRGDDRDGAAVRPPEDATIGAAEDAAIRRGGDAGASGPAGAAQAQAGPAGQETTVNADRPAAEAGGGRPDRPARGATGARKSRRDGGTTRTPASPGKTDPGDPPLKTDVYDQ